MSFILDALRKSERQRLARQSDAKEAGELLAENRAAAPRPGGWIFWLLTINAAGVAALILFLHPTEPSRPVVAAAKPSAEAAAPAAEKAGTPTARPPSIADWETAARIPPTPAKPASEPPSEPAVPPRGAPGADAPARTPMPESPAKKPSPLPKTAPVREVLPAPHGKSPPFLQELPADFQNSVPPFKINVFGYAADPAERFIVADMVKYRPGQFIKDSLKLKEIRQNSIIVDYNNRIFQIPRP